jgi:hypothetical protein
LLYVSTDSCVNTTVLQYTPKDISTVKASREAIDNELRRLKKEPHDPITEPLSLAYVAGFFDAEGSVTIFCLTNRKIRIQQRNPEILYALKRQFGGSVFVSKTAEGCERRGVGCGTCMPAELARCWRASCGI